MLILSIGGERLDTREPASKRVLDTLAGVAAWQHEAMLERQREGIAKAKTAGKYKGPPISIDAAQRAFSLIMAHRGTRAVVRQRDLFGRWANRWTVIRTSNLPRRSQDQNPAIAQDSDWFDYVRVTSGRLSAGIGPMKARDSSVQSWVL